MGKDLEIVFLELKISKANWLFIGTYKPFSLSDTAFTSKFSWSAHDNILFMGDFNMTPNNPKVS